MAIVELKKLSVVGLNAVKPQTIDALIKMGAVEINSQDEKLTDAEWSPLIEKDGDEEAVYALDIKIAEAEQAIDAIEKYSESKKPLFKTRKPVKEADFENKLSDKEAISQTVDNVLEIYKEITRLKNEESKINTSAAGLRPWLKYDLPLDMTGTKFTSIILGTTPVSVSVEEMEKAVDEKSGRAVIFKVSGDEQMNYIFAVCYNDDKDDVLETLRLYNFNVITFGGVKGTASENIAEFEKELKKINLKSESLVKEIKDYEQAEQDIKFLHDSLVIERDKAKVLSSIVKTKTAFYFDGWFPADKEDEVKSLLEKNNCYFEIKDREKDEEMPILMRQNALSEPFEAITDLYSTPSVNDIDPTPFLAPFYFIFFGLMLSDAGYGIILTVGCFIVLKKFRLEGMMKKLVKMFMYCGISTAFWGVMFGGWFGDFIPVAAKSIFNIDITIDPLWFNPVNEPMTLLVFSLILGAIHLFTGMGLKAYLLIKNGHTIDAVCDIFLWYVLLIGLVLFGVGGSIAPALASVGKVMSIVGVVGILLTGGRNKKGIGKITGGLGSLYGITSYLSDVLSYSRLLALGLATGVVAQVINTLGSLAGGGVIGAVVMIAAFLIGHTFNMAINVLGSFVHSSRLQYVEFFGKFFDGGGTPFRPFERKTKYVDIIKEEK
ncbi:V-type ATP synthase subunit I [Anaerotignum faecicola]|nr:V-type ATP synthase subunit I [Anaerotignum faecicola]